MDVILNIVTWIANNIFGTPAMLLGLIVAVGLLLQNKDISDVISGTIKAIIGFLIINAGSGVIVGALNVFEPMWKEVFGLQSTVLSNFIGQEAFSAQFGSAVTLIMTLGFLINVIIARFTKFKYIYLTGHMMFWTTMVFTGVTVQASGGAIAFWPLVAFLSVIMGLYWTLQPAITQPFMRKVTGNNNIAFGHTAASGAILASVLGKWFGNKKNDANSIVLPKKLEFLRDSNIVTSLTMGTLFVIGATVLMIKKTPEAITLMESTGGQNFIIYAIVQSLTFAAGIAVVMQGVRMFIGEMVPAFNGIATKVVPGAVPALDCPVVYPYSANAVVLGFLGGFAASILWLLVLGNTVGYVFIPTMIAIFFHSAAAGVFGNSTGGIRGAIIGGFVTTTIIAWGQYFMVTFLAGTTIPDTVMWAADTDMFLLGPIIYFIAKLLFGN